jgi:hypothetical protein
MSETPKLQPGTQYHIEPTESISITGADFVNIQNTLNRVLSSPIYQEHLAIANTVASIGALHELFAKKLSELVESGQATVAPEQPSNSIPLGGASDTLDAHIMD